MRWLFSAVLFLSAGSLLAGPFPQSVRADCKCGDRCDRGPACRCGCYDMAFEMLKWGDCVKALALKAAIPFPGDQFATLSDSPLSGDRKLGVLWCGDGKENAFRILPVGQPSFDADDATIWSYTEGCDLARKTGKPLVTYVGGGRGRCVTGAAWVTCYTDSLSGARAGEVRVSVWVGESHWGRPACQKCIAEPGYVESFAADIRQWATSRR